MPSALQLGHKIVQSYLHGESLERFFLTTDSIIPHAFVNTGYQAPARSPEGQRWTDPHWNAGRLSVRRRWPSDFSARPAMDILAPAVVGVDPYRDVSVRPPIHPTCGQWQPRDA